LTAPVDEAIGKFDLVAASVLSGNRNFEARVHQSIKANFLMSPPLVVAFALAGRVDIDLTTEPIGTGKDGREVYLKEIWPSLQEIRDLLRTTCIQKCSASCIAILPNLTLSGTKSHPQPDMYTNGIRPAHIIQEPPFFLNFNLRPGTITEIKGARPLGIFGDSVTTDHISPRAASKNHPLRANTCLNTASPLKTSTATDRAGVMIA
jgi:aconitate hydratase